MSTVRDSLRREGASEIVPAIGLAALGVYMVVQARSIAIPAGEHSLGPRFFPTVVGAVLIGVGAWLAFSVLRGERVESEAGEDVDTEATTDWRTLLPIVGVLIGYVLLIQPLGYLLATIGLFGGTAYCLGARGWRRLILLSVLVPFVAYMLFTRGLGVYLPNGILQAVI